MEGSSSSQLILKSEKLSSKKGSWEASKTSFCLEFSQLPLPKKALERNHRRNRTFILAFYFTKVSADTVPFYLFFLFHPPEHLDLGQSSVQSKKFKLQFWGTNFLEDGKFSFQLCMPIGTQKGLGFGLELQKVSVKLVLAKAKKINFWGDQFNSLPKF